MSGADHAPTGAIELNGRLVTRDGRRVRPPFTRPRTVAISALKWWRVPLLAAGMIAAILYASAQIGSGPALTLILGLLLAFNLIALTVTVPAAIVANATLAARSIRNDSRGRSGTRKGSHRGDAAAAVIIGCALAAAVIACVALGRHGLTVWTDFITPLLRR